LPTRGFLAEADPQRPGPAGAGMRRGRCAWPRNYCPTWCGCWAPGHPDTLITRGNIAHWTEGLVGKQDAPRRHHPVTCGQVPVPGSLTRRPT
jgi:hypothetical protein